LFEDPYNDVTSENDQYYCFSGINNMLYGLLYQGLGATCYTVPLFRVEQQCVTNLAKLLSIVMNCIAF